MIEEKGDSQERNTAFSESVPRLQVAWDSTSLGLLKECPRKYYYRMIRGLVPKKERVPLVFGIYFHSALEVYERMLAQEGDRKAALRETVRGILKDTRREADDGLGGKVPVVWVTEDNTRTRETLLRAVILYAEHFENDRLETVIKADGEPAVELSFKIPLQTSASTGEQFILCGHIDKLVRLDGRTWVLDHKTTKMTLGDSYFQQFSPNNQMSLYTSAAGVLHPKPVAGIIIDAVQLAVSFVRFHRHLCVRTKQQLEEWYRDMLRWLKVAELFAELDDWPMNENSCHKWSGCEFRDVCNKDEAVREAFLEADFKEEVWNPLVNR